MNKEKIVWVKIKNKSYYNTLIKLNDLGITIYDNKKEQDYLLIKTTLKDYGRIKKYLISLDAEITEVTGILKVKQILKKYVVFTLASIISIILLFLVNNLIFRIDVKTNNPKTEKLVLQELKKHHLKTLTLKIPHQKIEVIVRDILNNNKDTLEWLEIKYDGLIMIVNVTEKTKTKEEEEYPNCNIIAKTDAKISSLNIYKGVALKEINDYVLKGEVILSGSITHNEEVKDTVCASGEVYGEVWYKVKVEVPFKESYVKYTGKIRYNLNVKLNDNKYRLLRSRIDKKKEEEINLYKLNDFEINLVKEKEYVMAYHILSENEAYNKALQLAEDKIKLQLDKNEEILVKKVLKKEANDSTIYLEIFIVTKENIGEVSIVREEVLNDSQSVPKSNE